MRKQKNSRRIKLFGRRFYLSNPRKSLTFSSENLNFYHFFHKIFKKLSISRNTFFGRKLEESWKQQKIFKPLYHTTQNCHSYDFFIEIQFSIWMKIGTHAGCAKNFIFHVQYTHFSKIMGSLPYFLLSKLKKSHFSSKTTSKILSLDDTCSDGQIAFNIQSWSGRALKPHSTSIILKDNFLHHKFFVRMLNLYTFAYSYPG